MYSFEYYMNLMDASPTLCSNMALKNNAKLFPRCLMQMTRVALVMMSLGEL